MVVAPETDRGERGVDFLGGLKALCRVLVEAAHDGRFELPRDRRLDASAAAMGVSRICLSATTIGVSPVNGDPPGEDLVEDEADRVDVGAGVDRLSLRPARAPCRPACR